MYYHKIVNADSNEETIIPLSAQEIAIIEANIAKAEIELTQAQIKAQAKATAEAKLAALGLTADDLKALGLG